MQENRQKFCRFSENIYWFPLCGRHGSAKAPLRKGGC